MDDGWLVLPVAVDTTVALFQPIGIERQLKMDQVMAPLVEVESLGRRIGAYQN